MKHIRTGLTTQNFASLLHNLAYVSGHGQLLVEGFLLNNQQLTSKKTGKPVFSFRISQHLRIEAKANLISINDDDNTGHNASLLIIKPQDENGKIVIADDKNGKHKRIYSGELIVIAQGNNIRLVLNCPIEEYVISVIRAEMPASYKLEAIKTQAVSARTYALHPRVNHKDDLCDVCDSYLCCQAFSGWQSYKNSIYQQASVETSGEILVYKGQPILSLFSSCAGGHTENYEDCFSDWQSGLFPPKPLPYLRGISENIQIKSVKRVIDEAALIKTWQNKSLVTFDSWSPQFRWSMHLSIEDLESTMHHVLADLITKKDFAPFILPPPSMVFGNIKGFSIDKRGLGGTALNLTAHTSKGNWQFTKELVIRSLFKNKSTNFKLLPSAKIFFDHCTNDIQLIALTVYGLGHGHGVGMQQVGAQGMAKLEKNYKQILNHYYTGIEIETV